MPSDNEGSTKSSQARTPTTLTSTSKMPQATAQASSMPQTRSHLLSDNSENAAKVQHGSPSTAGTKDSPNASVRPSLPRDAPPAPAESPEPQSSPPSSHGELSLPSTGPTSGSTPSQSLDVHNKIIIAVSATLAYLQSQCRDANPIADLATDSKRSKVKALTKLSKGLIRNPGATIAISADIFQSEILVVVAHDDGSRVPPEMKASEGKQPVR